MLCRKNIFAFCISSDYWPHVAVAIYSLVLKTKKASIVVFYDYINEIWKEKILKFTIRYGSQVEFIKFDATTVNNFKICGYLGVSAYFRIFLPKILTGYDRIVYLDSDIVVKKNPQCLFDIDLENKIIAARAALHSIEQTELCRKIGMDVNAAYFNSGVLIIDVELWNSKSITEKTLNFIQNFPEKISFADQCALNAVFNGNFKILSPEWNVAEAYFAKIDEKCLVNYSLAEVSKSSISPSIIHFNGCKKPWHYACRHPFKGEYIKLRRKVDTLLYISDDFSFFKFSYLGFCFIKTAYLLILRFLYILKSFIKFIFPKCFYISAVNLRRTWRDRLRRGILELKIRLKWFADKRHLPLTLEHWELYTICHRIFWRELHDFPNLVTPRDFNDRIQWLKLFDQSEAYIQCSDKILVRDYVREKIGEGYLVDLYQTCETFNEIDFTQLPSSFVMKTNHDNGTVILVKDKSLFDQNAARHKIESALKRIFGWELGEWAYAFVPPRILIEELIEPDSSSPPPDFKFQCVEGNVKFCRYTYDRGINTKEIVLDREGNVLNFIIDENFKSGSKFNRPAIWDQMVELAEKLSDDFKCVRVDFLVSKNKIYVGEMTFFPYFGAYKGEGQIKVGVLLDFDRTTFKPPIYHKLPRIGRVPC
jgi:lipopolysaccharide biosynthesis glycosyltransferase